MTNTLKHEDIFPGMIFEHNFGKCKIMWINRKRSIESSQYLIASIESYGMQLVSYFCLEDLNKLEFLGIQTEPVQLGVVKRTGPSTSCFTDGEIYPYFGSLSAEELIIRDNNGFQFRTFVSKGFELINAQKPETPNEVTVGGVRYVLPESEGNKGV